jgi:Tol biopolymer transport system component
LQVRRNVWSVAFGLDAGKIKGPLEQVTKSLDREEHAALSRDGRYVAFTSPQTGNANIWLREIATGKELRVAESPLMQRFPVINPSGSKVAFSVYSVDGMRSVYIASPGGTSEIVCQGGCLRATDWSSDERSLLIFGGNPYRVSMLDIASGNQTVLLRHDKYSLLYGRYSPDNRWVSFTARVQPNHSKIMIAPVRAKFEVPESQWIDIAEAGPEDWANWSPDGRTIYFTSPRDGHFCLWAQRIDPVSRRPAGKAFPALHLHGNANYQQGGWSAAGDRIAMVLTADSGNVWLLSRSGSQ